VLKPREDLLVLEEQPGIFTYLLGLMVIVLFGITLYFHSMERYADLYKILPGAGFLFVIFPIIYKKSRFEFDRSTGRVVWSRKGTYRLEGM